MTGFDVSLAPALAAMSLAEEIVADALAHAAAGVAGATDRMTAARHVLAAVRYLPEIPAPVADCGPYLIWNLDADEWVVHPDVDAAILMAALGELGPARELRRMV